MGELLMILNKVRDKCVKIMNKNLEIYRAFWNKTTFHRFLLSTSDTIN